MSVIMVGTDGSEGAAAALGWGAAMAGALDGELLVVTAAPSTADQLSLDETRLQLDTEWSALTNGVDVRTRTLLLVGDPRVMLQQAAASQDAALTVLGATGKGWYPATHLSSVGHYVAQHAINPVAIIPQHTAPDRPRRIVLGLDGSPGSRAALAWCTDMAGRLQAEVLVVHAHLPAARAGRPADPAGWLEAAEQQCRQWTAPLSARGVLHSIDIVEHNPASALLSAAGRHGDVVVVGTRGAGGFRGLQLGSVALGVLHHATVPTVVVPPPPE